MTTFGGSEVPNLPANVVACVIYGALTIYHVVVGIWYRQWWFMGSWSIGLALEFGGYVSRVVGHFQPDNDSAYICQTAILTFAPAFFMAGIYYQLGIFIRLYGRKFSLLGPRMTSYFFIGVDVLSILIQGAGGGIASSADDDAGVDLGKNIMVAGLIVQVVGTTGFLFVLGWFYVKGYREGLHRQVLLPSNASFAMSNLSTSGLRDSVIGEEAAKGVVPDASNQIVTEVTSEAPTIHIGWLFPMAIVVSSLFIYARSIYRVIELSEGWNGYLMYHEIYFLILETLLVVLGVLVLSVFHPGFAFGRGNPAKRFANGGATRLG